MDPRKTKAAGASPAESTGLAAAARRRAEFLTAMRYEVARQHHRCTVYVWDGHRGRSCNTMRKNHEKVAGHPFSAKRVVIIP